MKLLDLRKIHQGDYLTYYVADYLNAANKIKSYEFISRKNNLTLETFGVVNPIGVVIIALNEDGSKVLLPLEHRLATNNWIYNFPAGLIEKGESPLECAKRELYEETGIKDVSVIRVLPPSFPSQAISDEAVYTVLAYCKGKTNDSILVDEEIKTKWYSKEEVLSLINNNALMSVRTQMFLYFWSKDEWKI